MLTKWLDRIEARVGRHRGIRNLMNIVVIGTVFVYLADFILPFLADGRSMSGLLAFSKARIMQGQIWRLVTFIFVPERSAHLLLLAFGLYFDWLMGDMLQNTWGTFRFTLFYTVGMLGAVISGCITGYATAYYLNMSLMLAVACIQPDMKISPLGLGGMVQLRMKWVALLAVAMMVLPLVQAASWRQAVGLIAALLNVILFFADKMITQARNAWRHYQWKRNWKSGWKR